MEIIEIDTHSVYYPFVENLLVSAFPEDERRDLDLQRRNVDENSLMRCCVLLDSDMPCGLLTYWDFGDFCYIEHFATDSSVRNRGIGAKAMNCFLSMICRPVVLEVEIPGDDAMAIRRIGFYSRLGYELWDSQPYIQPPYRPGGNPLPMHIMSVGGLDQEAEFSKVKSLIHRHVYGV